MKKTLREEAGSSFQHVALQFRLGRFTHIPVSVRQFKRQPTQRDAASPQGKKVIEPIRGTSALQLLLDLERKGYRLSDCSYEERGRQDDRHYMVFFVFAPQDTAEKLSERFACVKSMVAKDLFSLCKEALWESSTYINPIADGEGRVLHGRHWASIVFRGRQPYMQGNGEPVLVYPRDAAGERIDGALRIPLKPAAHLCMNELGGFIAVPA